MDNILLYTSKSRAGLIQHHVVCIYDTAYMKRWIAKVLTDHFSKIEFFVPMHSVWLYIQCTINDLLQKCLHPVLNATHSLSWIAKVLTSTLFGMQKCLYPSIAPPHKYCPIKCFEACHMIVDMTNLYTAFNQAYMYTQHCTDWTHTALLLVCVLLCKWSIDNLYCYRNCDEQ